MEYKRKRMFCLLLLVLLALILPVQAMDMPDGTRPSTLTFTYGYMGRPIVGAELRLYKVGALQTDGSYAANGKFAQYPVDLLDFNAAQTLYGFIQMDGLAPDRVAHTDADGKAEVTGLTAGLWLAVSPPFETADGVFSMAPCLVPLPVWIGDEWIYDAELQPKVHPQPPQPPAPIKRKVLKVWEDAGAEEHRPEKLEVVLLKDGALYDTVELTAAGNWRHTWEGLEPDHTWTIQERVPEGYKVSSEQIGITTVITNTWPDDPPGNPPDDPPGNPPDDPPGNPPDDPPGNPPDDPGTPGIPNPPDTPGSPHEPEPESPAAPQEELPMTGMLWWPVPVLMGLGILLLMMGLRLRKAER